MPSSLLDSLADAHRALAASAEGGDVEVLALDDETLLNALDAAAAVRRLVDARSALLAGEVARRSAPHLTHSGLAQRRGHRTPEELVRVTTGSSRHDARVAVRAGAALLEAGLQGSGLLDAGLLDAGLPDAGLPGTGLPGWAQALVAPVARGDLSTAGLEAIRSGLGDVGETVSADALES
ncbi:MAG: hypothetical protein K2X36_11555, partial [Microbacteriaceae bacterium]|nr:hypothetical protein [Microbacteriaceae bacterium]